MGAVVSKAKELVIVVLCCNGFNFKSCSTVDAHLSHMVNTLNISNLFKMTDTNQKVIVGLVSVVIMSILAW